MVRPANVARSRACQQCKKKRIKCDLTLPTCQRCIGSGILCSGPVSGLLMVDANSTSYTRRQQRDQPRPRDQPHIEQLSPRVVLYKTPALAADYYDDILLWRFLSYFSQNAGGRTWSARLPHLVAAKNAAAMKTAARAVSLAFAAQNTKNVSMAQAACEYYGNSLRYHQASFTAPSGRAICKKKAINALPVTVLLSYFEMIQATSIDAWLGHTLAAERLFLLLGPDALNDNLLNHLYFIVRANSAIRCFLLGTKTQLVERSWSEVPMTQPCGRNTAIFNTLLDLILWLSNTTNISNLSSDAALSAYSIEKISKTLAELTSLWETFGQEIGLSTSTYPLLAQNDQSISLLAQTTEPFTSADFTGLPSALLETSSALTAAFFHAAAIILLSIMHKLHNPSTETYLTCTRFEAQHSIARGTSMVSDLHDPGSTVAYHCSQILALAQFLRTRQIGCACLRMILPVSVVNRLGSSRDQCLMAENLFRAWSTADGLPGLAVFAFGGSSMGLV